MDISKTYISSLIPQGAVILDIGSYNGKDAAALAIQCNTQVHCFEPVSHDLIKERQEFKDDKLIVWPYAVGAFKGTLPMNISPNHPQSNTLKAPKKHLTIFPDVKYQTEMKTVNVTTLDDWNWSVRQGKPVDFIWCDVNGSEGEFILGAMKTLAVTTYLYIEFCEKELFSKALNRERLTKALPGFEVMGEYNFEGNYGNLLLKNKNKS